MAFTTGTATDYHDLLDKLRLYLVAQGWTQLAWTPPPGGLSTTALLYMRAPGAGAGQEVYISIQSITDGTAFNWELRGATGYDSGQPVTNQPNVSTQGYMVLHSTTITYWFYVNNRRVIVVAKMGTIYTSCYLGFFLPWGTPTEYPFPLHIGGSGYLAANTPATSNSAFRFFADPGGGSSYTLMPDNTWRTARNQDASASINKPSQFISSGSQVMIWPFHQGESAANTASFIYHWPGYNGGYTTGGALDYLRPTQQGERPLFPLELFARPAPGDLGALDGAYCVPGFGLVSEQQLTLGADTYRCFQNINRVSGNDFIAIKEI